MNSNAAIHSCPFQKQRPARLLTSAHHLSNNDRETAAECVDENRAPCRCETSKRRACCRPQSPDRDATGPSPETLCHCSCLSVRSLCKPRSLHRCLPDPRDYGPASREPSEALSREVCRLLARAKKNRSSDVPATFSRSQS